MIYLTVLTVFCLRFVELLYLLKLAIYRFVNTKVIPNRLTNTAEDESNRI